MCFGSDGYLYIAIGDEGGAGDYDDNAQDRSRIFGKILRIDVDQNVDTTPYHGIPPDNPYAGNTDGYREDIWAYGLRNPWRISFDVPTGRLIAGDVGQRTWEG
jgi:glucose/arabinose dehydrogenase